MAANPVTALHDHATDELIGRVRAAGASRTELTIRGGGTKAWLGESQTGDVLDVSVCRGIVDYDPAELVVTARCGTPLAELEAALAGHRQSLPFEPPHFGAGATIGGCVAAGLAGPRRAYAGAVRDFVLGATLLDGSANVLHFGGRVMKNVAGYDVARLLAGSFGILGIILEVSLKVLPLAARSQTLRFELDQAESLRRLNDWAGSPIPLSASAWQRDGDARGNSPGVLHVRLSGAQDAVASACAKLGGELLDREAAAQLWTDFREQRAAFFLNATSAGRLWRLSVPSTTAPLALRSDPLIEWGGAQRWYVSSESPEVIRELAAKHGGHATIFRHTRERAPTFTQLPTPLHGIQQRLKAAFDPARIFNPGRMGI